MTKLDPKIHIWLGDKAANALFAALPTDSIRFVGGCVRNAVLGEAVSDFDMATVLTPEALITALKTAGISVHETGLAHGTITAVCKDIVFEITTLRQDVSTDGRRATVAFTTDWAVDANRRDFTMNALYADQSGTLYDPTGHGIADAKAKKIRFVGDAEQRVLEDHLRILRYFRFCAWYAPQSPMNKQALAACRTHKTALKKLSVERVWSEIKKTLSAPDPHRIINAMLINEVLDKILPEASNAEGLQLLSAVEARYDLPIDPYLRLMAMAARDEFALAGLCRRMKMSNAEKTRIMGWGRDRTGLTLGLSERDQKIAIYTAGRQTAMDRVLVRAAGESDPIVQHQWFELFKTARDWDWPEFPITGQDLMSAGIPKGEAIGKAQTALKALWVRSGFSADKLRLLAALALIHRS